MRGASDGKPELADGIDGVAELGDGTPIIQLPASGGDGGDDGGGGSGGRDSSPKRGGWPKGRKRGSKPAGVTGTARKTTETVALKPAGISALLYGIHSMLAKLSASPELDLSKEESDELAAHIVAVARHYPALRSSEKIADIGNLLMVGGGIYGMKFIALRARKASGKSAAEFWHVGDAIPAAAD